MSRPSHFVQGEPTVQRGDIHALYCSRDTDPLRALGDMYHPPKTFEHGRVTLVADIRSGSGCQVRIFEARFPAVLFRIEAEGFVISTNAIGDCGRLVVLIALALASGEINVRSFAQLRGKV